ncbi:MAG: mannose-1-phosphate guanylyltransferase [Victivallales bacterium]|nr:mannose-1-phosphate guanylyltransferase [Victivallales bacterium]
MIIPVIMAGGSGKRFWPLSRKSNPKQFLRITSEKSMIQVTVERLLSKVDIKDIHIVTTASQKELVKQHLPDLPEENIILEPEGMNTAPAIALSAAYIASKYKPDDKMLVLAADHVIKDVNSFLDSLIPAEQAAEKNKLVTFGIKPSYPATGYGYIEAGRKLENGETVLSFKEKPDKETAESFFKSGNYYWNSGMFMWKLNVILNAYKQYLPKVSDLLGAIREKWNKDSASADISEEYSKMPKIPVDIGIMEQAVHRTVIPVDYGWSDVGSWKALAEITPADKNGNYTKRESEIINSTNCYIRSDKFTAVIDVDNIIVVETPDTILITNKNSSEKVKDIVSKLEEEKLNKYL